MKKVLGLILVGILALGSVSAKDYMLIDTYGDFTIFSGAKVTVENDAIVVEPEDKYFVLAIYSLRHKEMISDPMVFPKQGILAEIVGIY